MAKPVPFHYIDIRAFSYATEAVRRVETALRTVLPDEHPIERADGTGHYGDRIVICSARIETADGMRTVLDRLADGGVLQTIKSELSDRVSENQEVYVTLDKQAAYEGAVVTGEGIRLRGKIEAYPATRDRAEANLADGLGPWTT